MHVVRQACINPWLLDLSTSCPICRLDFQALETVLAGEALTERRALQTPRFSHFLRFARRRHRHRMEEHDPSPLSLPPVSGALGTRYDVVGIERLFFLTTLCMSLSLRL